MRIYLTNGKSMLIQNCHEENCLNQGFTEPI